MTERIAICICTYRRPGLLERLAGTLAVQRMPEPSPDLLCVIIDNDPFASARPVATWAAERLTFPVIYHVEPARGISHARNRAITVAREWRADFIAMIDDDERASENWLASLIRAQREHDCALVYGPVISEYLPDTPKWIVDGGFFDRTLVAPGLKVDRPGTGNLFVRMAAIDTMDPVFDPRFTLSGGEDTAFLRSMERRGYPVVSARDAVAYETVPVARANLMWLLRSAYDGGATHAAVLLSERPSPIVRLDQFARAVGRVIFGAAKLFIAVGRGRASIVHSARLMLRGSGFIAGMVGYRSARYQHTVKT